MKLTILLILTILCVLPQLHAYPVSDFTNPSVFSLAKKPPQANLKVWVKPNALTRAMPGIAVKQVSKNLGLATLTPTQVKQLVNSSPNVLQRPAWNEIDQLLDVSTGSGQASGLYTGCNADSVQALNAYGEGVLIGFIDTTTLNWKHQDFYTTSWQNDDLRIEAMWYQDDASGTPPAGYTYGTYYTKSNLNANAGPAILNTYHATPCAGIAAGDGSANGTRAGVAPAASIVFVKANQDEADIVDAIDFIAAQATARQMPVVLNLSLGSRYGSCDGNDPIAVALDNFATTGQAVSAACGNYYTTNNHAKGTSVYGHTGTSLSYVVSSANLTAGLDWGGAYVFYSQDDDFDVTVTDPGLNAYTVTVATGDTTTATPYGMLYVLHDPGPYIGVIVSDESGTITAGDTWLVKLSPPDTQYDNQGGHWHAWVSGANITGYFGVGASSLTTLNSWACGSNTLAVGGFNRMDGTIYALSSSGPTLDNRMLPQLIAPTNVYAPANSSSTAYAQLNGTSAAAPHAAGALALLLQRYPQATPGQLYQLLTQHANTDATVTNLGIAPNNRAGYGKLNVAATWNATPQQVSQPIAGNGQYQFNAVGNATPIANIQITTSGSLSNITVEQHPSEAPPQAPEAFNSLPLWYNLTPQGSGFSCNLSLYYSDTDLSAANYQNPAASEARLALYRYNGSSWQFMGGTVDAASNSVTLNGVEEFSMWTIADPESVTLPVQLASFNASVIANNQVSLTWVTSSETALLGFGLSRQHNGQQLNLTPTVIAASNSSSASTYTYKDTSTQPGLTYAYTLLTYHLDGTVTSIGPVNVEIPQLDQDDTPPVPSSAFYLTANPNPFNLSTTINFGLGQQSSGSLCIYNAKGQLVKSWNLQPGQTAVIWKGLDNHNKPLASGMYLARLQAGNSTVSRKLILLK